MTGNLVLVTGVTGFLGGHVANQLIAAGYKVRGTVRSAKFDIITEKVKVPGLEFVKVDDVITGDLSEALKGVHAVLHVASPLPGKLSAEETLNTAVDGTLNILRQTLKAGVEKIVFTGSFGNVMDPSLRTAFGGRNLTESGFGAVSYEEAVKQAANPFYVYFASKVLAEKAIWDFAKENPQLDIATILPGFMFGPWADTFPLPNNPQLLGTNNFIFGVMAGGKPPQPPPYIVDVRDSAKAHVLALNVPRKPAEEKRYFINDGILSWKQVAAHLNKTRPQIKTAPQDEFPDLPGPVSTLDLSRTQKDLQFGETRSAESVVDAAVDALLVVKQNFAT